MQFTLKQLLLATTVLAVLAALVAGGYCIIAFLASSLLVVGLIAREVDRGRRGRAFVEFLLLVSIGALVAPPVLSTTRACGQTRLSFTFMVTDADGHPIEGARVQIREAALISPAPPLASWPGVEGNTDSAGYARLTYPFPSTRLKSLCEHAYFAFVPRNYRVYFDSPGFEPADMGVRDFLGDQYDLRRRAPIEPIRIELRRTTTAP